MALVVADARHCVEPGIVELASVNRICKRTKKSQVMIPEGGLRICFNLVVSKRNQVILPERVLEIFFNVRRRFL